MYDESNVMMMRNIQPTSALPVTRNMPYYSASVPSRNQPRNMTGIYLGLEGNVNPPNNRGTKFVRARTGVSQKVRTPAEDRRYRKVEMLRIKEETKGFKGKALKARPQTSHPDLYSEETSTPRCSHPAQLKHRKWGPAKSADPKHFEDVIKRNPRNYTGIINNGVTRSENLTGLMSFAEHYGWDIANMPLPDALIDEVQRIAKEREDLAGLEECFKKVCKGNVESLHSLLPLRRPVIRPSSYTPGFSNDTFSTGFTVRSYRNPNKAEILADFETQPDHSRPKTVPVTGSHIQRQPLVPAPYFFKHFNRTGTANSTKKRNSPSSQFEAEQNNSFNIDKVFGGPGSGAISRSLRQGRSSAWSEGDGARLRRGTPRNDSPIKDINERHSKADHSSNHIGPLEIRAEGLQSNHDDKAPNTDRTGTTEPTLTNRSESNSNRLSDRKTDRSEKVSDLKIVGKKKSNMEERQPDHGDNVIRLDLETEDGKKQEIFLDDNELICPHEKERRASEALVASMQEDANQKKKELAQILTEHEEIVKTIIRQSSHESSNEAFQSTTNERDQ